MSKEKSLFYCGYRYKGDVKIPQKITACNFSADEFQKFAEWYNNEIFPLIDKQLDKIIKEEAKCIK